MTSTIYTENSLYVELHPEFYSTSEADILLEDLLSLPYYTPELYIRGRVCRPNRQVLAFGDEGLSYAFSGTCIDALPWTPLLKDIRERVQNLMKCCYNYVLINLYPDGRSKIADHKDVESSLDLKTPIAVVSLGAQRIIEFKRPEWDVIQIPLPHGSLYAMHPPTNTLFTHGIPADSSINSPRISLTFRYIKKDEPPRKKAKLEDSFDKMQEEWNLGDNLRVSVCSTPKGTRIYFKDVETHRVVTMLPPTFYELTKMFEECKWNHRMDSFIANNQLCVFSEKNDNYVLQQIFKNTSRGYNLNASYVIVKEEHIECFNSAKEEYNEYFKSYKESIMDCVKTSILMNDLPQRILAVKHQHKSCDKIHCSEEQACINLYKIFLKELKRCISAVLKCTGCQWGYPSQFPHECVSTTIYEQYYSMRFNAGFYINVFKIAEELMQEFCICHYNKNFFEHIKYDDYTTYAEDILLSEKKNNQYAVFQ